MQVLIYLNGENLMENFYSKKLFGLLCALVGFKRFVGSTGFFKIVATSKKLYMFDSGSY